MKKLILLGATGSVGTQIVDVVIHHPDLYQIVALSAGKNVELLKELLMNLHVDTVSVQNESDSVTLQKEFPDIRFIYGDEGLKELAGRKDYDLLLNALVGFVGFIPTLTAINCGHDVALANKETLVAGGELIQKALVKNNRHLYPIDSEHSAIFQCLQGSRRQDALKLIITASGGSFRDISKEDLRNVTVEQALNHPNWKMGSKITIDSATMMNKGFEVIEAHWLFDMDYDRIDVIMHRESVVHSMVEYCDHSVIAQLGSPDMRLPIQYALSWPSRLSLNDNQPLSLAKIHTLHFEEPDYERFPLLKLAYDVGRRGGNLPAVMNSANEIANAAFRNGEIPFTEIEEVIADTVAEAEYQQLHTAEDLAEADALGRRLAISRIRGR